MPGRNILLVMEQVLDTIPEEYPHRSEIKDAFDKLRRVVHYVSPENRGAAWDQVSETLAFFLPDPTDPGSPEWTRTISDIMCDRRIKEVM